MKMRKISKLALATAALLVTGAVALMAEGRNITVKGSDTLVILGQRWAEVFMSKNPGFTIQVTGGGSGTGIAALINGTTDICEASRPMKDTEKADAKAKRGKEGIELPGAVDGLAGYVNETNPM